MREEEDGCGRGKGLKGTTQPLLLKNMVVLVGTDSWVQGYSLYCRSLEQAALTNPGLGVGMGEWIRVLAVQT